jgi:hypothetical protein
VGRCERPDTMGLQWQCGGGHRGRVVGLRQSAPEERAAIGVTRGIVERMTGYNLKTRVR